MNFVETSLKDGNNGNKIATTLLLTAAVYLGTAAM